MGEGGNLNPGLILICEMEPSYRKNCVVVS